MEAFRCARCGAFNRMAAVPSGKTPVCGRCKSQLDVSGAPQPVDGAGLAAALASAPVPVLVDFWATWCGPCRAVAPAIDAIARARAGRLVVLKLDIDRAQDAARAHRISSVPTFGLFVGGREAGRTAGAQPRPSLERWIGEVLAPAAFPQP